MKTRHFGRNEVIFKQANACRAKKLAKLVVTEAIREEEKLEAMRETIRAKSMCVLDKPTGTAEI